MKKQFTEKDLVDFGNYLLSEKREETIENKENIKKVHDCDIANFKIATPSKKDIVQACIDQIEESGFDVGYVDMDSFEEKHTKQEIIDAYNCGDQVRPMYIDGDDYYNKTFNSTQPNP